MHLASRKITRHELLLRMIDEGGRIISPAMFLGVAEKFGLINRIDRWVVDHAIGALAAHVDHRLSFEVNLSGVSMGDAGFLEFVEQRLAESPGVDPSQLTFEVTETAAVANLSTAREFADRLSTLGCSFALDDFGSGFGGFYYLKYLPFSDLKIDGEFILHCIDNLTDRLVIDAVVTLARGLGKTTIAEYVEDADTLEYLATSGSTTPKASTSVGPLRSRKPSPVTSPTWRGVPPLHSLGSVSPDVDPMGPSGRHSQGLCEVGGADRPRQGRSLERYGRPVV